MKRQILLTIAYDGTNYSGYQIQKNGISVSEKLNKAAGRLVGKPVSVLCVSRTDAGVHALGQRGSFFLENNIPVERIPRALQCYLPDDIMILKAEEIPLDFYPPAESVGKHYRYVVRLAHESNPFDHRYVWHLPRKIEKQRILEAIPYLEGEHDFKAFTAKHSGKDNFVRKVNRIFLSQRGDDLIFDVWGEGFLYKMVRSIVGFLLDVGRGHFEPALAKTLLVTGERERLGYTAPSRGLTLVKIYFDEKFYLDMEHNLG